MALRSRLSKSIAGSPPAQGVINRSKQIILPGFYGLTLYEVWPAFIRQLRKTKLVERASGISFNVVMALPPTLLFVFTLIPFHRAYYDHILHSRADPGAYFVQLDDPG